MEERRKRILRTSKEKGITLVALVITIIIIIILATVTINMAFGDKGLIKQAQLAKDLTANSMSYEEEATANLVAYMNEMLEGSGTITKPDTNTIGPPPVIVPDSVTDAKPNPGEDVYIYEKTTPIKDDSGDIMHVPGGFGIAKDSATEIDKGVVITDGINEFVWIPVNDEDLAEMYNTTTPETASDIALSKSTHGEATTTTKLYSKLRIRSGDSYTAGLPGATGAIAREPDILTDTTYGDASTNADRGINLLKSELGYTGSNAEIMKKFAQDSVNEYKAVFESIKKYDGFYIGRYELTGTAENPTVQRHQKVLTAEVTGANTWYGLKDACRKVVKGENKQAQSHMIYGNQWDEVMDWLYDTGAKTSNEINVNSSTWGNYSDSSGAAAVDGAGSPQNSGYSDAWSANNIYDLAGNYYDWTQEASVTGCRVNRGRYLQRFRLGCSGFRSRQQAIRPAPTATILRAQRYT